MKISLVFVSLLCFSCLCVNSNGQSRKTQLFFCGDSNNDAYLLLKKNNIPVILCDDPKTAVESAPEGSGILISADKYPLKARYVDSAVFKLAESKNLKVYAEFFTSSQDFPNENKPSSRLKRAIIIEDVFRNHLKPLDLLTINDCFLLPAEVDSPLIALGKVAGFENAVYGVKDVVSVPILYYKNKSQIVATTKLSNFATGRYAPKESWKEVWEYILSFLTSNSDFRLSHWLSYVNPQFEKNEKLDEKVTKESITKGIDWFFNARLFVDQSWKNLQLKYQGDGMTPYGPPVDTALPNGNGSLGILEGPTSIINYDGKQQNRYWLRADVQGEVAYTLAAGADFLDRPELRKLAYNLGDYVFNGSDLRSGEKRNKNSAVFGLVGWTETHPGVFYGDDNARFILGMIGASAYLETNRWDDEIVENIVANFRTTGKNGFRGDRLSEEDILKNGWQSYWNGDLINPHPHFESWLWACYLWLYNKTGYKPFIEKAEKAIEITMRDYPDNWHWTNGLQQERARMILPLAWLVRVDDSPKHREWLSKVVDDLISFQTSEGAIREEIGVGKGRAGLATSNADYGTHEEPLIFKNGDPLSDMLYTCNFALFGLNEAAQATGDKRYFQSLKKLSDFLMRIQVNSDKFPEIDGAWFRAFDFDRWDYWGSNGDNGWGAWTTLTGWIQSWIITTNILVDKNLSYWDITQKNASIGDNANAIIQSMLSGTNDN